MQETNFNFEDGYPWMNSEELASYKEKQFDLAKKFDRPGQRVIFELPSALKLREIIGLQHHPDKTTKVTFRRFQTLYLCWVPTSDVADCLERLGEEIAAREDWDDRWEPWELYGSTEPLVQKNKLIKSRLQNQDEFEEFKRMYGAPASCKEQEFTKNVD